ncbi:hypothetical protein D7V82_22275 [bacterium 1xD8-6]|nr:hypothetical protein D7V72_14210 [bacterium D16-36]RKI61248.1 hypothetical protein D7V82_22275 [bacterium 1xD8-6]
MTTYGEPCASRGARTVREGASTRRLPHDLYNTSDTRGTSQSYGLNYQKTGKELMSMDEISVMDGGKCIMQLRGVRPFFSNKFDITKHKQYRLLSDFDDKNALDIEKYVKNLCKARVRDNDTVDEVEDAGVIEA